MCSILHWKFKIISNTKKILIYFIVKRHYKRFLWRYLLHSKCLREVNIANCKQIATALPVSQYKNFHCSYASRTVVRPLQRGYQPCKMSTSCRYRERNRKRRNTASCLPPLAPMGVAYEWEMEGEIYPHHPTVSFQRKQRSTVAHSYAHVQKRGWGIAQASERYTTAR